MALVTFLPIAPEGATMPTGAPRNLPFPMAGEFTENPSATPLTYYPLLLSLDKAVEYWWRIKSWMLTYSIGGFSGTLVIDRLDVEQGDEQELCKPENYEWTGYADPGGPSGNRIAATIEMLAPQSPRYSISHTEVAPAFRVTISAAYFDGDSDISLTTVGDLDHPLEGTITFDGGILACAFADITAEPFTFTIEPNEWYSYSGTWEAATGAKN